MTDIIIKDATFSLCRKYRYTLRRIWDRERFEKEGACTFICLNPSTADETVDDPTVRRCINYAKDWGYPAFIMLNLFAFRATDPEDMKRTGNPVDISVNSIIQNNTLVEVCKESGIVVAGWGNHGSYLDRAHDVELLLEYHKIKLHCLKINSATRMPAHPLYLKKSLMPKLLKDMRLRP